MEIFVMSSTSSDDNISLLVSFMYIESQVEGRFMSTAKHTPSSGKIYIEPLHWVFTPFQSKSSITTKNSVERSPPYLYGYVDVTRSTMIGYVENCELFVLNLELND